ncbi:MAG: PAS domain S-box protein [Bacteroidales bacterium]|nr:PAS domain S-box protein [Bacteroidales bacterium]
MREISERKKAENKIAESQAALSAIFESTRDIIWSINSKDFSTISFNNALKDFFRKYRNTDINKGSKLEDLIPNERLDTWYGYIKKAIHEGPFEVEYKTSTGKKTVNLSFYPLVKNGEIYGISIFGKDITKLVESEKRLTNLLIRLRIILFGYC